MDEEKEWPYGVYMKPNGKLVLLEKDRTRRYFLADGRVNNNPFVRLIHPRAKDRPLVGWCGDTVGWGPTRYLQKCEYLGPLWERPKLPVSPFKDGTL